MREFVPYSQSVTDHRSRSSLYVPKTHFPTLVLDLEISFLILASKKIPLAVQIVQNKPEVYKVTFDIDS